MTVEAWRAEILDLVEDLAVVEGALVEHDGDQVDKRQSLRWIERTRARLTALGERTNAANGSRFLGCTNWPILCAHTEPLPEYLRLRASGAAQLPGMDSL